MSIKLNVLAAGLSGLALASSALAADQAAEHFMKESIQGNLAEVNVGNLAQQRGATQGVKEFGTMLAKDHGAANEKAQQTASSLGVTPPTQPAAKQKALYQELSGLSGEKFDRRFIKSMVEDHEEDIAKYEKESKSSGPAAEYAKAILPDLRKHLQMAQHLERQERSASASGAAKSSKE